MQQILPPSNQLDSTTILLPDLEHSQEGTEENNTQHNKTLYNIFQKIIATSTEALTEQELEVEAILSTRTSSIGETEYFVSWKNYSHRSNSWVSKDNTQCAELIAKYVNTNKVGSFAQVELPLLRIGDKWLVPYVTGIFKNHISLFIIISQINHRNFSKILLGS